MIHPLSLHFNLLTPILQLPAIAAALFLPYSSHVDGVGAALRLIGA